MRSEDGFSITLVDYPRLFQWLQRFTRDFNQFLEIPVKIQKNYLYVNRLLGKGKIPMIFAKPTKFNAGLTIYGDFVDFTSLHASIHEIADEENNLGEIGEYILGLAYEIRHAYQGDRMTLKMEGGTIREPTEAVYLGFNTLWTVFLPQLIMLRDAASYQVLNRNIQSDLWRLEACAEEALLKADANVGLECLKWLKNSERFDGDYYLDFISDLSYSYVYEYTGKGRFNHLPDILQQMNHYSKDYKKFAAELELFAASNNCSPKSIRDTRE